MYKTQMRWIEQAEERRFVGQAMFEQAPTLVWPKARSEAGARWLPRLGAWLAARHPISWETLQPATVLVRQTARRRVR